MNSAYEALFCIIYGLAFHAIKFYHNYYYSYYNILLLPKSGVTWPSLLAEPASFYD